MSNLPSVANAPRVLEELCKIKKPGMYRLMLDTGCFSKDEQAAWLSMADHTARATELLRGLEQWDANRGGAPAQKAVKREPVQEAAPEAAPEPSREPSTAADPANAGGKKVGRRSAAAQTPSDVDESQVPDKLMAGIYAKISKLTDKVDDLHTYVSEECAGHALLEEMHEVVVGMAKTQQTLGILCFIIAGSTSNMDEGELLNLVMLQQEDEALKKLLESHATFAKGTQEGK